MEEIFPADSRKFALKNHLVKLGYSDKPITTVHELEKTAKDQYAKLSEVQKTLHDSDKQFDEANRKARADGLKKPFNKDLADKEVNNHAMFNMENYDYLEMELLL